MIRIFRAGLLLAAIAVPTALHAQQNIILFVADGLRAAAVTPERAPTFARIRDTGVNFSNSHSVFPTITTANASVIATGHLIGDTGDFGNTFYTGFPVASAAETVTPFIQDNAVLSELNQHHGGNFIAERSIMAAAREKGYLTAAPRQGRAGRNPRSDPARRQDHDFFRRRYRQEERHRVAAGCGRDAQEGRIGAGNARARPTREPRQVHQYRSADNIIATSSPRCCCRISRRARKPFMLLYWSSDPDGTQHSQRDSINELVPGINGPTSLAAIKVADDDLAAIMAALKELGLEADTNIFVTADHGFSTVSKQSKTSPAAKLKYDNVPEGQLPPGFLAIDLAHALGLPLHEPSAQGTRRRLQGREVSAPRQRFDRQRSGQTRYRGRRERRQRSDLFPAGQRQGPWRGKVVKALLAQDYTSGVFVRDDLGPIPGTLPMSKSGPERRSANANAGHRREFPLRDDGLRPAAVLQRDRIRYQPVAGAGSSWQFQPRRYRELHGGHRARVQDRLQRYGPGQQRRHRSDA